MFCALLSKNGVRPNAPNFLPPSCSRTLCSCLFFPAAASVRGWISNTVLPCRSTRTKPTFATSLPGVLVSSPDVGIAVTSVDPSPTSLECLLQTRVVVLEGEWLAVVLIDSFCSQRARGPPPGCDGLPDCASVRGAHEAGPWRLRPAVSVLDSPRHPLLGTLLCNGGRCRRIEGEAPDLRQWTLFLTEECDFSMCVETSAFAAKWTQMVEDGQSQAAREFARDFVHLLCRSLRDGARACRASAQSAGRGPACEVGVRCAAG